MKGVLALSLSFLFVLTLAQEALASEGETFSSEQVSQIQTLIADFRYGMGAVSTNPKANCASVKQILKSRLELAQPLLEIAALKITPAAYGNGSLERQVLDASLAFEFVEGACANVGV